MSFLDFVLFQIGRRENLDSTMLDEKRIATVRAYIDDNDRSLVGSSLELFSNWWKKGLFKAKMTAYLHDEVGKFQQVHSL